jgi:phosphosulfolactate synthase (CoM biosynthesis protein A)
MHAFLRNLPVRSGKPRETGLTLVIDTGLSVNEATNLLSKAQSHIDFIKLGFGTAALMKVAKPLCCRLRTQGVDATVLPLMILGH